MSKITKKDVKNLREAAERKIEILKREIDGLEGKIDGLNMAIGLLEELELK